MLALVFTVALACAAPVPPEDENTKALKPLQGQWKMVEGEEKGEAGDAKGFGSPVIRVEGDTLTLTRYGKEAGRFKMKLAASKSPAHLDLVDQGKDGPEGTCHAIYKLEGKRLTICFANHSFFPSDAQDRPTKFETGPSDQRPPKGKVMFVFEQVKK